MADVRLILPEGLDDHPRPKDRRVDRFVQPLTQMALWLWVDGRVERHDRWPDESDTDQPDDTAGGGRDWRGDESSWQVGVLVAAGYNFEPVLF